MSSCSNSWPSTGWRCPRTSPCCSARPTAAATTRLNKLVNAGLLKRQASFRSATTRSRIPAWRGSAAPSQPPKPTCASTSTTSASRGFGWLHAAGRSARVRRSIPERRLRSHDGFRDPDTEPLAVRLGGFAPHGNEQLHYPDLVLLTADGRRIALELELTPKSRTRLEKILAGYGADPRFDGVVYLVDRPLVARSVQSAARRLGISDLVHIQRVRSTASRNASAAALTAERDATSGVRAIRARAEAAPVTPRLRRDAAVRRSLALAAFLALTALPVPRRRGRGECSTAAAARGGARASPPATSSRGARGRGRARRRPARAAGGARRGRAVRARADPRARAAPARRRRCSRSCPTRSRRGRPVVAIDMKGSPSFARELAEAAAAAGRPVKVWTLDGAATGIRSPTATPPS